MRFGKGDHCLTGLCLSVVPARNAEQARADEIFHWFGYTAERDRDRCTIGSVRRQSPFAVFLQYSIDAGKMQLAECEEK